MTSPFLASICPALATLADLSTGWPDLEILRYLLDTVPVRPTTRSGQSIRIVPQAPKARNLEERYEARIYLRGELQTRERNWHDLFNALVWATHPKAKAAINARHYGELARLGTGQNRSSVQDALTLFDEGGVIVLYSEPILAELLLEFEWKELFWTRRGEVLQCMRFMLFGHALMEHTLDPFIGLTGKGLLLEVPRETCALPLTERSRLVDELVASFVMDPQRMRRGRDLAPIPILGIPGWWPANEDSAFYDDTQYFRPRRRAARSFHLHGGV